MMRLNAVIENLPKVSVLGKVVTDTMEPSAKITVQHEYYCGDVMEQTIHCLPATFCQVCEAFLYF